MKPQTFTCQLDPKRASGYTNSFDVPESIADVIKAAGADRLVCSVNDAVSFHCSLQSWGAGRGYYIQFSKQLQRKTGLLPGDELWVSLAVDDSKYGLPLPEEWAELLAIDDEVSAIFEALSPGRQRSILHLVSTPKRESTRIQRALLIADNLRLGARDPKDFLRKL